jgi:hypothetical protein
VLLLFYFFAAISIWLGLLSLRGGVRFVRYLQNELARKALTSRRSLPFHAFARSRCRPGENVAAIFAALP